MQENKFKNKNKHVNEHKYEFKNENKHENEHKNEFRNKNKHENEHENEHKNENKNEDEHEDKERRDISGSLRKRKISGKIEEGRERENIIIIIKMK